MIFGVLLLLSAVLPSTSFSLLPSSFSSPTLRPGTVSSTSSLPPPYLVRGGSTSLPSLGSPQEYWSTYLALLAAKPLLTKSITAGVILGASDTAGQLIVLAQESPPPPAPPPTFSLSRALRFAFFGFALQAPWNHFYYLLLDGALPPTVDPITITTGVKVLIDQFLQAPFFTVLIFAFLGFLEGKSLDEIKQKLSDSYVSTLKKNWLLWIPATVVNIGFCPPDLRVLYLNVVSFFWFCYLSLVINDDEAFGEEGEAAAAAAASSEAKEAKKRKEVLSVKRGGGGDDDEKAAARKKQQIGALAVLAFGVAYDFFVTHHGVGFWSAGYIP